MIRTIKSFAAKLRTNFSSATYAALKSAVLLVPLAMICVAMNSYLPEYLRSPPGFQLFIDDHDSLYLAPIFLFGIFVSMACYKSAIKFPVNHWYFLLGLSAALSGIMLFMFILLTKRIEELWIFSFVLLTWITLNYKSSRDRTRLEQIKANAYGLVVGALFLIALFLPAMLGVNYQVNPLATGGLIYKIEHANFPNNDPCFFTLGKAWVNTFGFAIEFREDYSNECVQARVTELVVKKGVENNNAVMAALATEIILGFSEEHRKFFSDEIAQIKSILELGGPHCIEDSRLRVCISKIGQK